VIDLETDIEILGADHHQLCDITHYPTTCEEVCRAIIWRFIWLLCPIQHMDPDLNFFKSMFWEPINLRLLLMKVFRSWSKLVHPMLLVAIR